MTRKNKIQITSIIFLISSSSVFYSLRILEVHLILTVLFTMIYMILFIIMLISYEFSGMVIKVLPNKDNLSRVEDEEPIILSPREVETEDEPEQSYVNPDIIIPYATRKPLS